MNPIDLNGADYVVGLASPSCNTGKFTFSHTEMTKRLCLQRLSFQFLSHSRKCLLSVEAQSIECLGNVISVNWKFRGIASPIKSSDCQHLSPNCACYHFITIRHLLRNQNGE